jgi:hypothetical protein
MYRIATYWGFTFYEIFLGRDKCQQQFTEVIREGELGWLRWHLDKSMSAKALITQIREFPPVLSQLIHGMMAKDPTVRVIDLRNISETLVCSLNATVHANVSSFCVDQFSPRREIGSIWGRMSARLRSSSNKLLLRRASSQEATFRKRARRKGKLR